MKTKKAKKPISEEFVKRATIKWLLSNGWTKNLHYTIDGEKGEDIRVRNTKVARYFIIETKGDGKKSGQSKDENNFVVGFGQIQTRITTRKKGYYYGLSLPASSAKIAIRRIPYQLANELKLHVFSVSENGKVTEYKPSDLKRHQKK
ncbi:MAG: hypothetical protein JNK50_08575 [Bacteroidia bacterium]|nr:hypothetical protein [Bacteroidia bacterium]